MKMAKSMQSISAPVLIILISACSVRVALPLMRCVSLQSTIESEAREEGPIDSAPAADKIIMHSSETFMRSKCDDGKDARK